MWQSLSFYEKTLESMLHKFVTIVCEHEKLEKCV